NMVIAEAVDLYRGQDTGVEIRAELAVDLPPLLADANRLRQILNNLLRNALDALQGLGEGRGIIILRSRMAGDAEPKLLELSVMDNGPGFPPEILKRVFEPYVTSKVKGSGLGLAIVRRIVEEHGGTITADNEGVQGGARILIHFPLTDGAA
ncbi:MAG: two-component sensor histidine kinase, partial [Acidithiobacillus ferrivorans]